MRLEGLIFRRKRRRDGTLGPARVYYRTKGKPLVRLPDLPLDHPDFLAAYAAARQAAPERRRAGEGTIAAAITVALASDAYAAFSRSYRATMRRHLDAIRAQADDALLRDLRPEHIRADLAALKPAIAAHRLKAWRLLCGLAAARGALNDDPSLAVRRPRQLPTRGHPPWTDDDVAKFRKRWPVGTTARLCFEVLLWTGARISDAVRLGPGMVGADGVLAYRQVKTGGLAHVPWSCPAPGFAEDPAQLRAVLGLAPPGMLFLAARERPRSVNGIGNLIREAARAAGVEKSAHGLRKTRATRLAEGGATPFEIAAWTGHESLAEVERYTREADRRRAVTGTERDENSGTPRVSRRNPPLSGLK